MFELRGLSAFGSVLYLYIIRNPTPDPHGIWHGIPRRRIRRTLRVQLLMLQALELRRARLRAPLRRAGARGRAAGPGP
eukprot:scaffold23366_cov112-Isochrysis_galbana.AAC.1